MRIALIVVGAVMSLMGLVWILQGIGILPGSFMSGQSFWAYVGVGMDIIGSLLVVLGIQMGRKKQK